MENCPFFKLLKIENVKDIILLQQKNQFIDGWSKEMLNDGFNKGGLKCLGAYLKEEELVAFITYSVCGIDAEIQDLLVDSSFRKKGIATKLIKNLFENLLGQKVQNVFLEVRENNVNAINLYIKNGFTQITIRKKYYSNGENALVMKKTL